MSRGTLKGVQLSLVGGTFARTGLLVTLPAGVQRIVSSFLVGEKLAEGDKFSSRLACKFLKGDDQTRVYLLVTLLTLGDTDNVGDFQEYTTRVALAGLTVSAVSNGDSFVIMLANEHGGPYKLTVGPAGKEESDRLRRFHQFLMTCKTTERTLTARGDGEAVDRQDIAPGGVELKVFSKKKYPRFTSFLADLKEDAQEKKAKNTAAKAKKKKRGWEGEDGFKHVKQNALMAIPLRAIKELADQGDITVEKLRELAGLVDGLEHGADRKGSSVAPSDINIGNIVALGKLSPSLLTEGDCSFLFGFNRVGEGPRTGFLFKPDRLSLDPVR